MSEKEFLTGFGLQLKLYRLKAGLTQADLGEMVDISEHRLSEIERGKCNLTLKTVYKIANALHTETFKFFKFDE